MSMSESSETNAANFDQSTAHVGSGTANASQYTASFIFGAQKLALEQWLFAGNEALDRAQNEMHLFSEFASKMAGAHSVKDIRTMYEECGKHQIEFVRRDCDRLFRHGENMIEAASKLFKTHPLN